MTPATSNNVVITPAAGQQAGHQPAAVGRGHRRHCSRHPARGDGRRQVRQRHHYRQHEHGNRGIGTGTPLWWSDLDCSSRWPAGWRLSAACSTTRPRRSPSILAPRRPLPRPAPARHLTPAAATTLVVSTQPSATATAGPCVRHPARGRGGRPFNNVAHLRRHEHGDGDDWHGHGHVARGFAAGHARPWRGDLQRPVLRHGRNDHPGFQRQRRRVEPVTSITSRQPGGGRQAGRHPAALRTATAGLVFAIPPVVTREARSITRSPATARTP